MSHTKIVELGFAQDSFTSPCYTAGVFDREGNLLRDIVAASEHVTVASIVSVSSRSHTQLRLCLSDAQVHFLETGEFSEETAVPIIAGAAGQRHVPSNLNFVRLIDGGTSATFNLSCGRPAKFTRAAISPEQFKNDMSEWYMEMEELPAIDFTDALLGLVASYRKLELPRELRPARFGPFTHFGKAAESQKSAATRAFLRDRFLDTGFAQNAGRVSILAAFSNAK